MTITPTQLRLDGRGKTITTAVVFEAAARLRGLPEGGTLELITDDFEPFVHDIATWAKTVGHVLEKAEVVHEGRRFVIKKRSEEPAARHVAVVLSTAQLEELLSPLGFALAAALEGMAVSLYFQGPGVRILREGYHPKLRGWARPFSRVAERKMAKSGHAPAQQKIRQLRSLGANIYVCGPSMQQFGVSGNELMFEGLPIVEYLTFMPVMASADALIYS